MIRMYLCGGLGNQLFQYAFGRALSLASGVSMGLDTRTGFVTDRKYRRCYELDAFLLPEEVERIEPIRPQIFLNRIRHHLALRGMPAMGCRFERDMEGRRPQNQLAEKRFMGYWQSEVWFADYGERIREDLRFRDPLPESVSEWERKLRGAAVFAVHVRRRDYARMLPLSYYNSAILQMKREHPDLEPVYFSDDPDWCENQLFPQHGGSVVRHTESGAMVDFHLMTLCRNYVIANSTYSWWAAWIGSGTSGRVMSPCDSWWNHLNVVPDRWQKISSGEKEDALS